MMAISRNWFGFDYPVHDVSDRTRVNNSSARWFQYRALLGVLQETWINIERDQNQYERYKYQKPRLRLAVQFCRTNIGGDHRFFPRYGWRYGELSATIFNALPHQCHPRIKR